jgi:hypothetical protein
MYIIYGRDLRYGGKQIYGKFKNLNECLKHLNFLEHSTLGTIIKFSYKEVE